MAVQKITTLQSTTRFIEQMFQVRRGIQDAQDELSSGLKINQPSDDPARAGTISVLQDTLTRLGRHSQRMDYAVGMLDHQESTLNSANDIIIRLKEIGTQAANETVSSQTRAQMAEEVWRLRDQLATLANTQYQGSYIYGGAADSTPPFGLLTGTAPTVPGPAGAYPSNLNTGTLPTGDAATRYYWVGSAGSTTTRMVQITDDQQVRVNTSGQNVFSQALGAAEILGRALQGFRTSSTGGIPTGVGNSMTFPQDYHDQTSEIIADIDRLDTSRNNIIVELNNVGSRLAQVDQAKSILASIKENTEKVRSSFQDADVFDAASRLQNLQTGLQGLLASGAQINNLSLLNFI